MGTLGTLCKGSLRMLVGVGKGLECVNVYPAATTPPAMPSVVMNVVHAAQPTSAQMCSLTPLHTPPRITLQLAAYDFVTSLQPNCTLHWTKQDTTCGALLHDAAPVLLHSPHSTHSSDAWLAECGSFRWRGL